MFEIDGAEDLVPYFQQTLTGQHDGVATVEFTTTDPQGREQVTSVAKLTSVMFKRCGLDLSPSSFGAHYALEVGGVQYGTPAATGGGVAGVQRALTTPIPVVSRATALRALFPVLAVPPSPHVTGALSFQEAGRWQSVPVQTVSFSLESVPVAQAGAGGAKLASSQLTVAQTGSGTPALQTLGKSFLSGRVSFVSTGTDGKTARLFDLEMTPLVVSGDQVAQSGGAQSETTSFSFRSLAVVPPSH
jgi:hypothetical protein